MSEVILFVLLVCSLGISNAQAPTGTDVTEIYPSSQRVAEGSRVLFTCVTSLDQPSFAWGKPVRRVDERRDGVQVRQIGQNMSTLEIPVAHIKRHKRTFRCTVTSNSNQQSTEATLKVIPRTRLHKNFPRITAVRQEAKYQYTSPDRSDIRHVSTEVQCITDETQGTQRPTIWRWILGSNSELKYTSAFKTGRLEKTADGHLLIHNPQSSDYETTYICAAESKYGTFYSQPIVLNKTSAPGPGPGGQEPKTCVDRKGREVQHGELYMPEQDPCVQCTCANGKQEHCLSVSCKRPLCQYYQMSEDVCCEFECKGVEREQCRAYNGTMVPIGEVYKPDADPCLTCECLAYGPAKCASPACIPPRLPCADIKPVPGKCCEFVCDDDMTPEPEPIGTKEQCRAYNGTMVPVGEVYKPEADPCLTCQCSHSGPVRCASPSCIPPPMPCTNIKPVPGKCCQFECDDGMPPKPEPIGEKPMTKVLGHIYVQQVGPRSVIVQWKLPGTYDQSNDQMKSFSVNVFDNMETMAITRRIKVTDRMYAQLDNLDINSDYYIMINGTSEKKMSVLMTRMEKFSLSPRASNALVVADSLGQMYESRGSIRYDEYSLPRQFTPIINQQGLETIYMLNSFHAVEVSTYNEHPCPKEDCGLMRFYMYETNGEMVNRMSLMFVDDRDFLWAKAHL